MTDHEQQERDLVPGKMRCARCKFVKIRTILCVQSGTAHAGDNSTEPCPNGCGPLWPVTWEQEARDGYEACEALFKRAVAAEERLKIIEEAQARAALSQAQEPVQPDAQQSEGNDQSDLEAIESAIKSEKCGELAGWELHLVKRRIIAEAKAAQPTKGGDWNAAIEAAIHALESHADMDLADIVASIRSLKSTTPAPREVTDMLTPLDQMAGYTDPLIFGKYSVRDFHMAPSGEGPKAYEWKDKPHRLVYDLCRALLAAQRKE